MTGVSLGTSLEIFGNPHDLNFSLIPKASTQTTFGIVITRSREGNFKPLLSTGDLVIERDVVIDEVKHVLEDIVRRCKDEPVRDISLLQRTEPEPKKRWVMDSELIEQILEQLRATGVADTAQMQSTATT